MRTTHEIEDLLDLVNEIAPQEGERWLGTEEKRADAERVLPALLDLLGKVNESLQLELTMNQIASKENWGVVKLLEEDVSLFYLHQFLFYFCFSVCLQRPRGC